jgi:Nucleotidyltransferase of unknown function (DUF6036)
MRLSDEHAHEVVHQLLFKDLCAVSKSFEKSELLVFLKAIDRNLKEKVAIMIIGGAAAILKYDLPNSTSDIDVYIGLTPEITRAADAAQKETGYAVEVNQRARGVADFPENYDRRIIQLKTKWSTKLTIAVPEKYDLCLSKIARGDERDLAMVQEIHSRHPLSQKTLIERFEKEMVFLDPRKAQLNMLLAIKRLYGLTSADELADSWNFIIGRPPPHKF